MTPARPLAASVAALGIAGLFAVPVPADAVPAPCLQAGSFAAQSGAELFRVNKLEVHPGAGRVRNKADEPAGASGADPIAVPARKPAGPGTTTVDSGRDAGEDSRPASADMPAPRPTASNGEDGVSGTADGGNQDRVGRRAVRGNTAIRDLRVGEVKSAMVGTGSPSAAAVTRMVNSAQKSKLSTPLVQQAPPNNAAPDVQRTPAAEAGPLLVDAGMLTSQARWAPGMGCGATVGEVTRAAATLGAAEISEDRDGALVVVPEKVESLSTTALERLGSGAQSVASASMAARTIELLDGDVVINVVKPPTLATSMSATGGGRVRYAPAVVEVSGNGVKKTKLNAAADSIELTFSDRTESGGLPTLGALPIGPALPLPGIPGLPLPGSEPESAPDAGDGTSVKITLGEVRTASEGQAVAARASGIKIVISKRGYGDHDAGATLDMEVGVLEAAAVAADPVRDGVSGAGGGLPVTGPGAAGLMTGGAGLLVAGVVALAFGARPRRFRA